MGKKKRVKGYNEEEMESYGDSLFDDPEEYQKFLETLASEEGLDSVINLENDDNDYPTNNDVPVVTEQTLVNIMRRMGSEDPEPKPVEKPKFQQQQQIIKRNHQSTVTEQRRNDDEEDKADAPKPKKDNVVCPAIVGDRRIQISGRKECILSIDGTGRSSVIPFYKEKSDPLDEETLANVITTFIEACELNGYPDAVFLLDDPEFDDLSTIEELLKNDAGYVSGRKTLDDGTQLMILQSKIYSNLAYGYILEADEWMQKVGQGMLDVMIGRASLASTFINGFSFLLDSNILLLGQRIAIYEQLVHYGIYNRKAVDKFVELWKSTEDTDTNMLATGEYYESHVTSMYEYFSELIVVDSQVNAEEDYGADEADFDPYETDYDEPAEEERTGGSVENTSFRKESNSSTTSTVCEDNCNSVQGGKNIVQGGEEVDRDLRESASHQPLLKEEGETETERERAEKFRAREITAAQLLSEALDEVKEEKGKENHEERSEAVPSNDREERKETKMEETQITKIGGEQKAPADGDRLLIDPIM